MMIFKLLIVLGAAKPPKPLNWTPGMTPQIHNMFKTIDGQSLDIILTSAPVLRLKAIEHEIQLKCFEQVVDLTQPGRFAHNLRREIRSLRESEIKLKSDFVISSNSNIEFFLGQQQMSYLDCNTLCITKNSRVVDDLGQISQWLQLFGEEKIRKFWVNSIQNQSVSGSSYYSASYSLKVLMNGTQVKVFPKSDFNNEETDCFTFRDHKVEKCSDITNLGAMTLYFEQHGNDNVYYNRHLYNLALQVKLNGWYQELNIENKVNLTMADYHLNTLKFQTFIPRPNNIKKLPMELATCLCNRHRNVTNSKIRLARSTLQEADLVLSQVPLGLETARIKGHGNQHLSSVAELLQDRANEQRRTPVDQYLRFNDIYDLFVNSSDWIRTHNGSSNISLVEQWLSGYPNHREQYTPITRELTSLRKDNLISQQSQQPQQPQALVGSVSLGALKLFSIGAPYLYDHTSEVVGKIMTEHKGFWIKPDLSPGNMVSAEQFHDYLNGAFSKMTGASFSVGNDRLNVAYPEITFLSQGSSLLHDNDINEFSLKALQLQILTQKLKQKLPNILVTRLLSEVAGELVKNSSVFVEILESKSFLSFRLYYQSIIKSSTLTNYKFYTLPHAKKGKEQFFFQIANVSINMEKDLYLSSKQSKYFECVKAVMGNVPLTLEDKCIEKSRVVGLIEHALVFKDSYTLMIQGPGVLHYSCNSEPASMYAIHEQVILFLIHDSCNLHGVFADSIQYHFKAKNNYRGNFTVLPLLKYKVPFLATRAEKVDLILLTFAITLGIIGFLFILITLGCLYAKKKLGVRITRNQNKNIELQVTRDKRSQSTETNNLDYSRTPPLEAIGLKTLPKEGGKQGMDTLKEALGQSLHYGIERKFDFQSRNQDDFLPHDKHYVSNSFLLETFPAMEIGSSRRMSKESLDFDKSKSHRCKTTGCVECPRTLIQPTYPYGSDSNIHSNTIIRKVKPKY